MGDCWDCGLRLQASSKLQISGELFGQLRCENRALGCSVYSAAV